MDLNAVRQYGEDRGYWAADEDKPTRPKELLEEILRQNRISRSAAFFSRLARRVALTRCVDPAFDELKNTLGIWFPLNQG